MFGMNVLDMKMQPLYPVVGTGFVLVAFYHARDERFYF